ncbi:hypothetical protein BC332_21274 [Capsicum chinense]|nr:hypothetical protein BC332_21274 [Capsicum chinense]
MTSGRHKMKIPIENTVTCDSLTSIAVDLVQSLTIASQWNKNWCPVPGILLNTSFFTLDNQSLLKEEAKKMENEDRTWMYNRTYTNRTGLRAEYKVWLDGFITKAMALDDFLTEGTIRCPCWNCKCCKLLSPDDDTLHLYRKDFMVNYTVWTVYGESSDTNNFALQNYVESPISENNVESSQYSEMVQVLIPKLVSNFRVALSTFLQWKGRGEDAAPMTWKVFQDAFFDKFFPLEMREAKIEEFMNLTQGSMTIKECFLKFN